MLKLSIILPTYNVERFIENCIRSLETQDIEHQQYEIIVVDDGATDGSVDEVIALQQEYENIILIRQTNAGLSAARNRGMRAAKGQYLLFVDTDDCVETNCFAKMLSVAESHKDIDLVGFNYRVHFNSGLVATPKMPLPGVDTMNGVEYYQKFVAGDYHVWRYLFSREFMIRNDLFFMEGISFEDVEFTPRVMCMAKSVIFCDFPFYHYYNRPGSISTTRSEKHISSRIRAAENLHRFLRERADHMGADAHVMFYDVIAECLLSSVSASHRFPSLLGDLSKAIRRLPFYPLKLSKRSKHRWEAGILNRSVALYWIYSYTLSLFREIRSKTATAAAIAKGPAPVKKFIEYSRKAARHR
jgi:glycosyltransferase involved in cell wall biosynthesis